MTGYPGNWVLQKHTRHLYEIGYAAAIGTVVVGYRTDWRRAGDNEAAVVNLQLVYFIEASGGTIVTGDPTVDDAALLERAIVELTTRVAARGR